MKLTPSKPLPALLTRKSNRCFPPRLQRLSDIGSEDIERARVSGIKLECCGLSSHCFDLANNGFCLLLVRVIREDDVNAPASEADGGITADAAASSCDNGGSRHVSTCVA
jgi:hypothetical protein